MKSQKNSSVQRYSLAYLDKKKTLCTAQADDLKIEKPNYRVWLSRCSVASGEPYNNKVTIEEWIDGEWIITAEYQAL